MSCDQLKTFTNKKLMSCIKFLSRNKTKENHPSITHPKVDFNKYLQTQSLDFTKIKSIKEKKQLSTSIKLTIV